MMSDSQQDLSEAFAARMKQMIGDAPVAATARRMGFNKQTLDGWLKGRIPRADDAVRLADGFGVDLRWLMTGEGVAVGADMVQLPRMQVQPSAGSGRAATPIEEHPNGEVAFAASWLRTIGVSPRQAHVLFARGDSMEPTIRDGDLLIVDRSISEVIDAGIYVVTIAGMVLVKRVQVRRDGSLVLKSDNGRYDDEVVPYSELASLVVEGRVCWSGRPL